MTEKVKLPKAVCNALGLVKVGLSNYEIVFACKNQLFGNKYYNHIESMVECLNEQDADAIMRALVLGYEPISDTPEELMKDIWFRHSSNGYLHKTIRQCICLTLKIHGIHYDWLKDDAE